LFTYASEWARARESSSAIDVTPLTPWQSESVIDVVTLQRFLFNPAASFYNERLKVRFEDIDIGPEDDEPFVLNGLENYAAADVLLQQALMAGEGNALPALSHAASRLRQQGVLPAGGFGTLAMEEASDTVERILQRWRAAMDHWSTPLDACELRYEHEGLVVEGWLDDLRSSGDHEHVRLLTSPGKLLHGKVIRHDKLLRAWVMQLLANACDVPLSTRFFSTDATIALSRCEREDARTHLNTLINAWRNGMQSPLPIARRTAFAWLLAEEAGKDAAETARLCYEGSDAPYAPQGEVVAEPYLTRSWPNFGRLFAEGFERWLVLYRPLLKAAVLESNA
jgi:exodeoxyribonuclease V gamma subunit